MTIIETLFGTAWISALMVGVLLVTAIVLVIVMVSGTNLECGTDTILDEESDKCIPQSSVCDDGSTRWNSVTGKCESKSAEELCGRDTSWDPTEKKCIPRSSVCDTATVFNTDSNRCEVSIAEVCGPRTSWDPRTQKCETSDVSVSVYPNIIGIPVSGSALNNSRISGTATVIDLGNDRVYVTVNMSDIAVENSNAQSAFTFTIPNLEDYEMEIPLERNVRFDLINYVNNSIYRNLLRVYDQGMFSIQFKPVSSAGGAEFRMPEFSNILVKK